MITHRKMRKAFRIIIFKPAKLTGFILGMLIMAMLPGNSAWSFNWSAGNLPSTSFYLNDSIQETAYLKNGNSSEKPKLEVRKDKIRFPQQPGNIMASASATYTSGNIETDRGFTTVSQSSGCPGHLTVTIPAGAVITGVDVEYDMTALSNGRISYQRSQLRCTSPGGTNELSVSYGIGYTTGTYSYSRTGLNIANGVTGGGDITFELHAGRSNVGWGCSTSTNRVDNNTWTVTIYYTAAAVADFTASPTIVDVGQQVTFTDASTGAVTSWYWDFGADAVPATATTQGPHPVVYSTAGEKTVSLTVNGSSIKTKSFYVNVSNVYNSVTATYSSGDIPTDYGFQSLPGSSSCPGTLTVTIPAGAIITGVDVEYDMTAQNWGWMSEQRSQLRCISTGGADESSITSGVGTSGGTYSYSRTGLTIANGVTGGGNIVFELHAGRTWTLYNYDCSTNYNYVNNNTWTVTVYFVTDPIPNFYADQTVIFVGESTNFTDISLGPVTSWNWNFGSGAVPATAGTQGPHTVTYNTSGYKDVTLTVNGSYTKTKNDYIVVTDPNDWLKWDDNVNSSAIGLTSAGTWQTAARFEPSDYSSYGINPQMSMLRVYIGDLPNAATVKIWQGSSQQNLVEYVSQAFTPQADSWNTIVLAAPYNVISGEELWFGVEYDDPGADFYPAGVDAVTTGNQKSNLYRTTLTDPNAWYTLASAGIAGDWNLQAYLVVTGSWIGVVSPEWEDPNNWYNTSVPDAASDVTIPVSPNDPVISSNVTISNLEIDAGAAVTVSPDYGLTVSGDIQNNAGTSGLVIQSSAMGTGALVNYTPGVHGTFQRYIKGNPEAWHGLSSPMTDQEISGDFTPSGTYADGTGYDFYTWYEPDTAWIYLLNDSYPPTWADANSDDMFHQGKGYLASYQDTNPTLSFQGTLATGAVNMPVTLTTGVGDQFGSNLVGNPYPSSIDWKAPTGWTRDALDLSGGGYSVWVWNDTANNYGVYNSASTSDIGTLGVTRHIPPTQGFFVLASQNGTLGFTDDVRVTDGSSEWLKSKGEKPEAFFMSVVSEDGNGDDEILLELHQDESQIGSFKRFSFVPAAPGMWIPKNGQFYSTLMIDSLKQYPVLPLSFKAGQSGSFKLRAEFDRSSVDYATLTDKQTGQVYNLLEEREISFLASDSDNPGRFILQFSEGNFPDPHDQLPIRIYSHYPELFIDLRLVKEPCKIELYNIAGIRVFEDTKPGGLQYSIQLPWLRGAFVVAVTGNTGRKIQKVVF